MTHIAEDYAGAPSTVDTGSAYGQAKRVSEFMSTMYGRTYGFDAIIARLFAFVGPLLPLDANYAVGNFVRDVLGGGPVRIAGDGRRIGRTCTLRIWRSGSGRFCYAGGPRIRTTWDRRTT